MGLAEGEKKRSDRLHVIAPFSRDSRGSRLAPTSFYLIIWYPGLTSGLCVNPRKSTAPLSFSPFTNHIKSEEDNPAIPGCRWSWSGFNTLRGVRAAEIRVCFTQDVIWARSETVAILYFSKRVLFGSAGRSRAHHAKDTRYGICICSEPRWNCCR